jgi:hypothetical protein
MSAGYMIGGTDTASVKYKKMSRGRICEITFTGDI